MNLHLLQVASRWSNRLSKIKDLGEQRIKSMGMVTLGQSVNEMQDVSQHRRWNIWQRKLLVPNSMKLPDGRPSRGMIEQVYSFLQLTSFPIEFANKSGPPSASKFYLQGRLCPWFPLPSARSSSFSSCESRLRLPMSSLLNTKRTPSSTQYATSCLPVEGCL